METPDESVHIGSHWERKILDFYGLMIRSREYYRKLVEDATKAQILASPDWYRAAQVQERQLDDFICSYRIKFFTVIRQAEERVANVV